MKRIALIFALLLVLFDCQPAQQEPVQTSTATSTAVSTTAAATTLPRC